MKKYTIYITPKGERKKEQIKRFFKIDGFTVNGEATVMIEDQGAEQMLKETALRGFIQIRHK